MTETPVIKARTANNNEVTYSTSIMNNGYHARQTDAQEFSGTLTAEQGDRIVIAQTRTATGNVLWGTNKPMHYPTIVEKDAGGQAGLNLVIHQGLIDQTTKIVMDDASQTGQFFGGITTSARLTFFDKNGTALHVIRFTDEQGSSKHLNQDPIGTITVVDDNLKPTYRGKIDNGAGTILSLTSGENAGQASVGTTLLRDVKEMTKRGIVPESAHPDGLSDAQVHVALKNGKTVEALLGTDTPEAQLRLATERSKDAFKAKTPAPVEKPKPDVHPLKPHVAHKVRQATKGININCTDCDVHVGDGDVRTNPRLPTTPPAKLGSSKDTTLVH